MLRHLTPASPAISSSGASSRLRRWWPWGAAQTPATEPPRTEENTVSPGAERPSPPPPDREIVRERVIAALRQIYDPEIPVNIYDLGLIYGLDLDDGGQVHIRMTLTAPGCPVAQTFPGTVEAAVRAVEGVNGARVDLVWDPPWSQDRMSEEARLQLGLW